MHGNLPWEGGPGRTPAQHLGHPRERVEIQKGLLCKEIPWLKVYVESANPNERQRFYSSKDLTIGDLEVESVTLSKWWACMKLDS